MKTWRHRGEAKQGELLPWGRRPPSDLPYSAPFTSGCRGDIEGRYHDAWAAVRPCSIILFTLRGGPRVCSGSVFSRGITIVTVRHESRDPACTCLLDSQAPQSYKQVAALNPVPNNHLLTVQPPPPCCEPPSPSTPESWMEVRRITPLLQEARRPTKWQSNLSRLTCRCRSKKGAHDQLLSAR